LCDEHGIGGSGEYFGDNDANLYITSVLYREALGVIDVARASSLGCLFRPGNFVGKIGPRSLCANWVCISSIFLAAFEVNSDPHTGARPSTRLCVGPELSRCIHLGHKPSQARNQ
jgi:hypothetical protein